MSASGVGGRREAHAFAAFVVSGGVAAGVNVVSRYVLSRWLTFEAAVAVAFILAMTTAFLLNRAFVFRSSARWIGQYGRFSRSRRGRQSGRQYEQRGARLRELR